MKALTLISAFVGGAIVGCGAALLFAPEKGTDVRSRISDILKKHGCHCSDDEVDALIAELSAAEA